MNSPVSHHAPVLEHAFLTRRQMLSRVGMGFGSMAMGSLFSPGEAAAATLNPLALKKPHFEPKAKRVVHFFMNGGPSHVDTFDPKPMLTKMDGKALPNMLKTERPTGAAYKSPFAFSKRGQCGLEMSELFPKLGEFADDLCVIRSMHADVPNHEPSLGLMNSGVSRLNRPTMGSWITYGLGSANANLPGYISMCPGGMPTRRTKNWQAAFLPSAYQGAYINTEDTRVEKRLRRRTHQLIITIIKEKQIKRRIDTPQSPVHIEFIASKLLLKPSAPIRSGTHHPGGNWHFLSSPFPYNPHPSY